MDRDLDWSWIRDPQWVLPFLAGGVALALFALPPFRHLWREVKLTLSGVLLMALGLLVAPLREGLLGMGTVMVVIAFWLFLGAPGKFSPAADAMGEDGAVAREIDHSVAPHDIDDPSTSGLGSAASED